MKYSIEFKFDPFTGVAVALQVIQVTLQWLCFPCVSAVSYGGGEKERPESGDPASGG